MDSSVAIPLGAEVRSSDGVVGTVEHLATVNSADAASESFLLVRSRQGQGYYRIPPALIRRATAEGETALVVLTVSSKDLAAYYVDEPLDLTTSDDAAPIAPASNGAPLTNLEDPLVLPLLAEELVAETRPISLGSVHIHKGVEVVDRQLKIAVAREEVLIEHILPQDYDPTERVDPDETIIPVVEEKIVFEKRRFVKEYIRIRKRRVSEEQVIADTVRQEYVEVREQPAAAEGEPRPPLFLVR